MGQSPGVQMERQQNWARSETDALERSNAGWVTFNPGEMDTGQEGSRSLKDRHGQQVSVSRCRCHRNSHFTRLLRTAALLASTDRKQPRVRSRPRDLHRK